MVRYILLVKYTEIGISQIQGSINRAAHFRDVTSAMGVLVESQFWTLGEYDGVLTLVSDDEEKVVAVTTHLAQQGYVRTCLMRAYAEGEFAKILAKMPSPPVTLDV